MKALFSVFVLLLVSFAPLRVRTAQPAEFLYVENSNSGDVSVISIQDLKVINTIKVGKYPDDVVATSAGDVVYINRVNLLDLPLPPRLAQLHVGESGEVIAVSTATDEIVWRLPVSGWPHHMTLTKDDRLLFVPLYNAAYLEVIDTQKRAVVAKVPVGFGCHGTKLSADGERLYVGSMMLDYIAVIDTRTFKLVKQIPFDDGIRPFAVTQDEKRLYAQLSRLHGFVAVDLTTDRIVQRVILPPIPDSIEMPQFFPHTVNHGLALTPDEQFLFVAASIADYVAVYSVPDLKLQATIPAGHQPNWVIFDRDGKYCYVSNRRSNDISVISVAERKEVARIQVGAFPQRMVIVTVPNRRTQAVGQRRDHH